MKSVALISSLILGSAFLIACGGGGDDDESRGGGDGDGDGDGDLPGDGDGDGSGGGPPVDVGTFEGLTGFAHKVAVARAECGLDASGVAQCTTDTFWDATPTVPLVTIAGGYETFCGLDAEGALSCWSDSDAPGLREGPFTSIGVGRSVACGTRPNGTLECWAGEDEEDNEVLGPPGMVDGVKYIDVVVAGEAACALMEDGNIVCWGVNFNGDFFPGDYSQVDHDGFEVCALTNAGVIECLNGLDETDVPSGTFVDIGVGQNTVCGVTSEGEIICGGSSLLTRLAPPVGDWVQIDLSEQDACAWSEDGTMECWGYNLGDGASVHECAPNESLLSGTLASGAFSETYLASPETALLESGYPGYRFTYELSQADPFRASLFIMDGSEPYRAYDKSNLPPGTPVDIDRLTFIEGTTDDAIGDFYCSASGSTVELSGDELLVELNNVHHLGTCSDGTPVSGSVEYYSFNESSTFALDGANFSPSGGLGGGYNPDDGSGSGTDFMDDGGVLRLDWGAGGVLNYALYVAPPEGDLAGGIYCTTTGAVGGEGAPFDGDPVTLTDWNRIDACPAETSEHTLSGCIR